MTPDHQTGRVIEDGALEPPVIEQETARLDQIDRHPKTRREPQQGPGILRNIRFEQGETHTTSTKCDGLYSVCCTFMRQSVA
jgi:hypothetical protein